MDFRSYDPAIARFTSIDPVTHHSMSTYTAFDNNPVFWADPSGADATNLINDIIKNSTGDSTTWTNSGDGTFSGSNGRSVDCDDCPKEGATRPEMVGIPRGGMAAHKSRKEYYHAGGVNGSTSGWKSTEDYADILEPVAISLAKSMGGWNANHDGSMQYSGSYDQYISFVASRNTVDGFSDFLISYANSLKNANNTKLIQMASGRINEDNLTTLAIFLPAIRTLGNVSLRSSSANFVINNSSWLNKGSWWRLGSGYNPAIKGTNIRLAWGSHPKYLNKVPNYLKNINVKLRSFKGGHIHFPKWKP